MLTQIASRVSYCAQQRRSATRPIRLHQLEQVVELWPILRSGLPALQHDSIDLVRTSVWTGESFAIVDSQPHHLIGQVLVGKLALSPDLIQQHAQTPAVRFRRELVQLNGLQTVSCNHQTIGYAAGERIIQQETECEVKRHVLSRNEQREIDTVIHPINLSFPRFWHGYLRGCPSHRQLATFAHIVL